MFRCLRPLTCCLAVLATSAVHARSWMADNGTCRVALEVMDGSGFLAVVGAGLSADVRPMKQESNDSLFIR